MCNIPYNQRIDIFQIIETEEFIKWNNSNTIRTQRLIKARIEMLSIGHLGDYKKFEGLIELRWKSGIRVYGFYWNRSFVVVLYGGNKNGQDRDIKKAKKIKERIISGTYSFSK